MLNRSQHLVVSDPFVKSRFESIGLILRIRTPLILLLKISFSTPPLRHSALPEVIREWKCLLKNIDCPDFKFILYQTPRVYPERSHVTKTNLPMKFLVSVLLSVVCFTASAEQKKYYLIGNSLTWDTVPSILDGDTQWHVDCGKPLPYVFEHPEKPCVKTSTLWPAALKDKQYDVISLQVHYGSTLGQDAAVISELIAEQPAADIVVHTGWARWAERKAEWAMTDTALNAEMKHHLSYFEGLLKLLRKTHPDRTFRRTRAMDMLQQVEKDIEAGKAPVKEVQELYRDKVHMNRLTGRYLMHNAMRHALGQTRSAEGFQKLEPEMKIWLDSVLNRVLGPE